MIDGGIQTAHHSALPASETLVASGPFHCIAVDGPLVPQATSPSLCRQVEQALASGGFARRCKAAFSHVPGTGRLLREHAGLAADRLVAAAPHPTRVPTIRSAPGIIEAFPNAYLGVCLPDSVYAAQPPLRRGRKFDWLYDRWLDPDHVGLFERLGVPMPVSATMRITRDHDERAALICLMTAHGAVVDRFATLGEPTGGWITLPPLDCWANWAQDALAAAMHRLPSLQLIS